MATHSTFLVCTHLQPVCPLTTPTLMLLTCYTNDHAHTHAVIPMTTPTSHAVIPMTTPNDFLLISPPADYAVKSIKWSPTETVRLHVGIYPYM